MSEDLKKIESIKDGDKEEISKITENLLKRLYFISVVAALVSLLLFFSTLIFSHSHSSLAIATRDTYLKIIFILFFVFLLSISLLYQMFSGNKSLKKLKFLKIIYKVYDIFVFSSKLISITMFCLLYVCAPAKVSGASMEGSYFDDDTILVWNLFYRAKLDDVVVIDTRDSIVLTNTDFVIKRIVATENDKVAYRNNALYVNDILIEYMTGTEYYNLLRDFATDTHYTTIPNGYCIVLGDNRDNSTDSRHIGLIHNDDIIGKSIFRILPFSNIGFPSKEVM